MSADAKIAKIKHNLLRGNTPQRRVRRVRRFCVIEWQTGENHKTGQQGLMFQQSSFKTRSIIEPFEQNFHRFQPEIAFSSDLTGRGLTGNAKTIDLVCLNLESLAPFEVVTEQFESFGITFKNAIAIQPSNPAFPTYSGQMLLLAAPEHGLIEINFLKPVSSVSGRVTSSRPTIFTAYNSLGKELVRKKLPSANLAGSNTEIPPNALLSAQAKNIRKVTFYAFDGQLTLDTISFKR